jgi:5-methylcytosine-specific restriction endonuclease McrA
MLRKPEPRKREKARERRARDKARRECRAFVIARDGMRCRRCRVYGGLALDVHELTRRSHGGSITDPANCVALCRACHRAITEYRLWAVCESAEGASGPMRFQTDRPEGGSYE